MDDQASHALARAVAIAGSRSALARSLGIKPQAIDQWRRVPSNRVLDVERITGVPRHELRPDFYPPEREALPSPTPVAAE